jgi:hypothetical protein
MQYINMYLDLLWRMFQFDIWVYSTQLWMYWCLLIPVIFYTVFFFFKWGILLFPILLPLETIVKVLRTIFKR